jgi:hypothetical protein
MSDCILKYCFNKELILFRTQGFGYNLRSYAVKLWESPQYAIFYSQSSPTLPNEISHMDRPLNPEFDTSSNWIVTKPFLGCVAKSWKRLVQQAIVALWKIQTFDGTLFFIYEYTYVLQLYS